MESKKAVFSVTKKDFTITYFSGTGAGGQHRNRHMNCVRIKHNETGILYTGQSHREREANFKEAFVALCNDKRFLAFCQMRLVELERRETLEERVDKLMDPGALKIEIQENGRWVVESE
ncbi:peptide chain release factor family protein [Pseudodesulfovibrio pelocollis]|uniref:peptide chain release factor family protein n=1 Tax=Pseudodesulfovibrio pelocollis TaxID=3051432 RepID=UPI00255ADA69|nr:peptide chain release factor-like protein [Pseudodesulfovibrio sp. SB368]